MRISCWAKGHLHCFCDGRHLSVVLKSRCRKQESISTAYKFECCNCAKVKYRYAADTDSTRIFKWEINWLRTTELNLAGEKGR